jgi:hypothetical protein
MRNGLSLDPAQQPRAAPAYYRGSGSSPAALYRSAIVDIISWRQADDATIADNFFRGHSIFSFPKLAGTGRVRITSATSFS